jgi:hypothetical protein
MALFAFVAPSWSMKTIAKPANVVVAADYDRKVEPLIGP